MEWQLTVNREHDGCIVDEQVKTTIGRLQEGGQLLDWLLDANIELVKLDLNAILKRIQRSLAIAPWLQHL